MKKIVSHCIYGGRCRVRTCDPCRVKVDTVASEPQSYRNMPSAGPAQNTSVPSDEHAHDAPARMGWARLLKRVFDLDLEHCPQCGGEFRIIAAIEEPAVIVRILTHLGLPARAPPRSPARPLPLFQAA